MYVCVCWVISYIFVPLCMPCPLCACFLVCKGKEKSGAKTAMIWGPVQCQEYCWCLTNSRCVGLCNLYSGCLLQSSNPSPFSRHYWRRSVGMLPWYLLRRGLTYVISSRSSTWKIRLSYWTQHASFSSYVSEVMQGLYFFTVFPKLKRQISDPFVHLHKLFPV